MAGVTFGGRDGILRLYDGTAGVPHYLEIPFVQMNFSGPVAKARPIDPIVTTVGGYLHSPTGPDYEQNFYEPQNINFSCWIQTDSYYALRNALNNIDLNETWKVGAHTWQSTKGRGSIRLPDNSYKPTALFFDQNKKTIDVQVRWKSTQSRGSIVGMRYDETYFAPQSITVNESSDFCELRMTGACYGNIEPIGDFSTGTSSI